MSTTSTTYSDATRRCTSDASHGPCTTLTKGSHSAPSTEKRYQSVWYATEGRTSTTLAVMAPRAESRPSSGGGVRHPQVRAERRRAAMPFQWSFTERRRRRQNHGSNTPLTRTVKSRHWFSGETPERDVSQLWNGAVVSAKLAGQRKPRSARRARDGHMRLKGVLRDRSARRNAPPIQISTRHIAGRITQSRTALGVHLPCRPSSPPRSSSRSSALIPPAASPPLSHSIQQSR
mmetsp:Transcript_3361/g.7989  ORF Transcript_3361/g.7989 Transcript_3361/m.7989 type:complete len:233 (+) Transcript_3361:78-776(+)